MFNFFEVGGAVRDRMLGIKSKDVDFSVVCTDSTLLDSSVDTVFNVLKEHLKDEGFKVFLSKPEFLTIRAQVPKNHPLASRTSVADFVLARRESKESDGRRPLWVKPGTLDDDLARRDFTWNAMAIDMNGDLIDPFNGKEDLHNRILRFVGDPNERIKEDGLRIMRAFRFSITKGFTIRESTLRILVSDTSVEMLQKISIDRIKDELVKMFKKDTIKSMNLLCSLPPSMNRAIFRDGLWLMPTLKDNNEKKRNSRK